MKFTNRSENVALPKVFGGSRSRTRKLQEVLRSEEELLLFGIVWEVVSKPGEEFGDFWAEEQPERSSFVNSNSKRELRGA